MIPVVRDRRYNEPKRYPNNSFQGLSSRVSFNLDLKPGRDLSPLTGRRYGSPHVVDFINELLLQDFGGIK